MIKIAITDDHTMFRKGISSLLKDREDMEVAFEAENGRELLHKLKENPVDLVLLDLQMPVLSGQETCFLLKEEFPDVKIIILTFSVSSQEITTAIKNGADGYYTKNSNPSELIKAIQNVHLGGFHIEKSLSLLMEDICVNSVSKPSNIPELEITSRELEIIKYHAQEYSGRQIAEMLNISPRTIESHKKNLMKKTDSRNFIGVILFVLENKILGFEDLKSS